MQAQLPVPRGARLRALAALLICVLTFAVAAPSAAALGARPSDTHGARHHVVVLTAAPVDNPSALHRTPTHGDLVAPPAVAAVLARAGVTSDSSSSAISRTARSSPGRGPPVQALA